MLIKLASLLFLGLGVFILVQVATPFLAFKVWEVTAYSQDSLLVDPVSTKPVDGVFVQDLGNFPAIVSANNRDGGTPYHEFELTIPTIKLQDIKVVVDSNDFEHNLAHLPGSALPGEKGNVFVTGHSSLAQFFKPDNFKAIFANLPNIKKGDEIFVTAGGQSFVYVVEGMRIVDPKEISVVNPPNSTGRYLSLMTCVPPGFNTKRLVVLARLK